MATVSTPLVYRSFCTPAYVQLAAAGLAEPALLAELPAELPHAASTVPSAATAAVIMIRRIVISPPLPGCMSHPMMITAR